MSPVSPIPGAGWWDSGDLVPPQSLWDGLFGKPHVGLSWILGALKLGFDKRIGSWL